MFAFVVDLIFIKQRHCARYRAQTRKSFFSKAIKNKRTNYFTTPVLTKEPGFEFQLHSFLDSLSISPLICIMGGLIPVSLACGKDKGLTRKDPTQKMASN